MSFFTFEDGQLLAEQVAAVQIAEQFGTPCYVYSRAALEHQWHALDAAFGDYPHLICYAVKANSNLAVLSVLARLGSGFDIVSGGELQRVLAAGGDAAKVVFSGVAKSAEEIRLALQCGTNGVRCINVESRAELDRIQAVAADLGVTARVGVRVNPDVDARTHPYIATGLETSKFGLTFASAFETYQAAAEMPNLEVHSMACHIGSQIMELDPFNDAVARVAELVNKLEAVGIVLQQLDLGGGLGINYQGEQPPSADSYVATLLKQLRAQGITLPVAIEPGRSIAGNAGILLTQVEYLKRTSGKNFAIVDAGMNDLLRPALYQAFHNISRISPSHLEQAEWEVVGPVCESSDVLGRERKLALAAGDILAIHSAGAYAFAMASNYNTRARAAEVLVDGQQCHLIRERESFTDLIAGESIPAELKLV